MSLDISSFCQNARTDLLRSISELCVNSDSSHNKKAMKNIFEDISKILIE